MKIRQTILTMILKLGMCETQLILKKSHMVMRVNYSKAKKRKLLYWRNGLNKNKVGR